MLFRSNHSNHSTLLGDLSPRQLRSDLQNETTELALRRGIIGLSLVSMAVMIPVALRQTGVLESLPSPGGRGGADDKEAMDRDDFALGVPKSSLMISSLASNIALASTGGKDRAKEMPWVPLIACGKALAAAVLGVKYLTKAVRKEEDWSPYFTISAIAGLAIAALTLPEALDALRNMPEEAKRRIESLRD